MVFMISSSRKSPAASRRVVRARGFTLVEILIAAALGAIIMAGVLSTFIVMGKTSIRVGNYSNMEGQTRRAFEQLGIDSRMASSYVSNFTGSAISSVTLTIPTSDLSAVYTVTYGYANQTLYRVPGSDPTATTGRRILISGVTALTFNRYNTAAVLIPASTTSDSAVKHIQVTVTVLRSQSGVANATQVIRSTAFTMRNISI